MKTFPKRITNSICYLPNEGLVNVGGPCLRALRPGPFLGFSLYSALRPIVFVVFLYKSFIYK